MLNQILWLNLLIHTLAGNFDIAREYFTPDGKHLFNNLEFDVDGIIEGLQLTFFNL